MYVNIKDGLYLYHKINVLPSFSKRATLKENIQMLFIKSLWKRGRGGGGGEREREWGGWRSKSIEKQIAVSVVK